MGARCEALCMALCGARCGLLFEVTVWWHCVRARCGGQGLRARYEGHCGGTVYGHGVGAQCGGTV